RSDQTGAPRIQVRQPDGFMAERLALAGPDRSGEALQPGRRGVEASLRRQRTVRYSSEEGSSGSTHVTFISLGSSASHSFSMSISFKYSETVTFFESIFFSKASITFAISLLFLVVRRLRTGLFALDIGLLKMKKPPVSRKARQIHQPTAACCLTDLFQR